MIETAVAGMSSIHGGPRAPVPSERTAGGRVGRGGLFAGLKVLALGLTLVVFALLAFVGPVHADSLVLAQTGLVIGNQTAQYSISIPSAGTLNLQLKDFDWPSPLTALTLQIATPTQILQTRSGAGDLSLSLSGAGTYYAYIVGKATGNLNIGAFGILGNFAPLAPVPLPASLSLLFAGMMATVWFLRRRDPKFSVAAVAAG